jgi:hypothetical protein
MFTKNFFRVFLKKLWKCLFKLNFEASIKVFFKTGSKEESFNKMAKNNETFLNSQKFFKKIAHKFVEI